MKRILFGAVLCGMVAAVSLLAVRPAFAEDKYSIKEMTAEVKAALDNRRDRFEQLKELKAKGAIGENNQGYVQSLTGEAKDVADAENRDRQVIYKTIEKQNNLTNAMATIEKVFAQVQRDKASPGDKIQDEGGHWTSK